MKRLLYLLAAFMAVIPASVSGQSIHLSGGLRNMHLWRGLQVADGLVLAADVNAGFAKDKFKVGLWGGTDFTGDYKEFDYYVSYSVAGFSVAVWDIFNYSPDLDFSKDIFNYDRFTTGHFVDLTLGYDFDARLKVPLRLSWSTIFAGRDLNSDGYNMFSTFVYAEYSVFRNEHWTVDVGVGGIFALNRTAADGDRNFYGTDNVNQLSLKTTYKLKLGRFDMPIFAHAMWNPDLGNGYLQVGVNLFAF